MLGVIVSRRDRRRLAVVVRKVEIDFFRTSLLRDLPSVCCISMVKCVFHCLHLEALALAAGRLMRNIHISPVVHALIDTNTEPESC